MTSHTLRSTAELLLNLAPPTMCFGGIFVGSHNQIATGFALVSIVMLAGGAWLAVLSCVAERQEAKG